MDNFFAAFNSRESIAILFFLLLAFLFGMLTGYLLRSRRVAQLRKALDESEKALAESQQQTTDLKGQLDLLNADLKKAMFEAEEQLARAARLEEENTRQYHEMLALNEEIERLRGANTAYAAHIEDLNNQILGLKMRSGELAAQAGQPPAPDTGKPALEESIHRLEALVEKLGRIEAENAALKADLAAALDRAGNMAPQAVTSSIDFDMPAPTAPEEPELLFSRGKMVLNEKIAAQDPNIEKDDLTRIEGVGPFLAQKLNEAGIYSYEQISNWDAASIGQITEAIGYFPGRIERDNWVGQAVELARIKRENPGALQSAPGAHSDRTDLQVIEGIGPKIEELLHNAGIRTWDDLAESPVERIEQILEEAGGHFRMHTPDTWPAQARLAANGDWELLHEYQDQLKGGRETEE